MCLIHVDTHRWVGFQAINQYETNYQLAATPPDLPGALTTLRAFGFGQFATYVIASSDVRTPLTIPHPFVGACDVLHDVFTLTPGHLSQDPEPWSPLPFAGEWVLDVPSLPPGLSFHVQHLSAESYATNMQWATPHPWGATNVLRIDT